MNKDLVEVIMENEGLIYSAINDFKGYYTKDDLYQVGVIGIIKAYNNFDPSFNVKFSTYACPFIRGEIRKYLREDKGLKISRGLFKLNSQIERAKDMLCQKLMREPTITEISLYLEIDEDKIEMALGINNFIHSLDEPVNSDGKELTLYDALEDKEPLDILDKVNLYDGIGQLPSKDKELLIERYLKDKTQMEAACMLGMSQVQVSRREQKVLQMLKQAIN